MIGALSAVGPAVLTATVVGLAAGPVLRRLAEPVPGDIPDGEIKTPYRELAGVRFALGAAMIAFVLSWTSWTLLEPVGQGPWVVLASIGVLLALIDLRTTWLPRRLTQLGWLLSVLALGISSGLSADTRPLLGGCLGALGAAAVYWLVWALSRGGFGFGDVRYAPLIGAAAGSVSWSLWIWALLIGTVVGAVVGLTRLVRRRRQAFPYAPSMLLGCYLALAGLTLA